MNDRYRIFTARKSWVRYRTATIMMQKIWRGALQRPIYRNMVKEAEEEARVNTKLAALQKRLADAEMKWIMADKARVEAEKRATGASVAAESNVTLEEKKEEEEETSTEKSNDQKALLDESTR